jgi:hypothetical protein
MYMPDVGEEETLSDLQARINEAKFSLKERIQANIDGMDRSYRSVLFTHAAVIRFAGNPLEIFLITEDGKCFLDGGVITTSHIDGVLAAGCVKTTNILAYDQVKDTLQISKMDSIEQMWIPFEKAVQIAEIHRQVFEAGVIYTSLAGKSHDGTEFEIDYVVIIENSYKRPIICAVDKRFNIFVEGRTADVEAIERALELGYSITETGVGLNESEDGIIEIEKPQVWIPLKTAVVLENINL